MERKELAPIVLFVYNRPNHTKKTIEGILANPEAKDSILYIFADGLKPSADEKSRNNLIEVRKYIRTIKGFKDVIIEESDFNRGLAGATIYGCTKVINKHDKMIMLEDDDIPTPYFLGYENACLNKYEKDERIWCVAGYTDTNAMPPQSGDDIFMVNRPSSWGFGTWKRCWEKIIWDLDNLHGLFMHKDIIRGFDKWGGRDHYQTMSDLLNSKNSSWSIRFHFTGYINGTYTIYPNKSLISNIGCDGTGTHCGVRNLKIELMDRPIVIPDNPKFDKDRNKSYIQSFYPPSIIYRMQKFALYHPWATGCVRILESIKQKIS